MSLLLARIAASHRSHASDPYWANVASLLHFDDGASGSTTFTDQTGRVWTASGNAQIATTQSKFGAGSLLLDGDGDYISCASTADMGFGTGDFTVECFLRPSVSLSGNRFLFDFRVAAGNSFMVWCSQTGAPNTLGYSTEGGTSFVSGGAFTVSAYQHIALTRSSGTIRGFVGGVLGFTTTDTRDFGTSQGVHVGSSASAGQGATGNADEVRITKGVARYTAAFTPPTAAFPSA